MADHSDFKLISKYLTRLEHFCYETLYEGNREKKDPQ